ncbi:hypothetical protein K3X41_15675 (plasmid) [Aliiroseovarius crassostreae]|uniref:beta-ketoacyl synthase N-terminal-like domain-containing protein n=1 Tax=Aliiroseovarius crassostreae TaxID=154981 RepID=UPI0021FF33E1|nr:beta-ketoacyl synthase N-terminal-like domain-containing protein [Aliiroseovarius crassostreae]UWQ12779.1 hypothetical protein K3X41_15675 [Aliiroseovarius crassostreae]
MPDSIVVTVSCADLPRPCALPTGNATQEMAHVGAVHNRVPQKQPNTPQDIWGDAILRLDHSEFEADDRAAKARQTRLSHRLERMIQRLAMAANLPVSELQGPGTGLVSGSQFGCSQVYQMQSRLHEFGPRGIDAVRFAQATHNYPITSAAIEFGIQGPSLAVVSGSQAGSDALTCALDWLRDGRCARVLVTTYEDFAPPLTTHLAQRARAPEGPVFAEAMVLMLLEQESAARSRGRHPILSQPQRPHPLASFAGVNFLGATPLVALHQQIASMTPGSPSSDTLYSQKEHEVT